MPKRLIDGEALWGSTKLAECPEWMIPEYAWFYCLADSHGCFELTNPRVILFQVGAIRPNLTLDVVKKILNTFHHFGLLFIWNEGNKTFGYWTGSDQPGRLPKPSQRDRYTTVPCTIPQEQLQQYLENIPAHSRQEGSQLPLGGDLNPGNGGVESRLGPDGLALAFGLPLPLVSLSLGLAHASAKEAECVTKTVTPDPPKKTLPMPDSRELHDQARRSLDDRAASSQPTDEVENWRIGRWHEFWAAYPSKEDEPGARMAFKALSEIDMMKAIEAIPIWTASVRWQQGGRWIPHAKNFLNQGNFRHAPPTGEEKPNGKPDPNTRTERNLEAFGVHHPKVARNPG